MKSNPNGQAEHRFTKVSTIKYYKNENEKFKLYTNYFFFSFFIELY